MSWIVIIFYKITSPFLKCKHDNVTYMLCILSCTLSSGLSPNVEMFVLEI
jgi:hypothetical protein